jgi:transposase
MNTDVESKSTQRRYSPEQKDQAVRMVFALREELSTRQGTVKRVADQLGIGVESLRSWVKQAEIDTGARPGVTSGEVEENKRLRQENRELKRANEILKRAAHFFGAELDRQQT